MSELKKVHPILQVNKRDDVVAFDGKGVIEVIDGLNAAIDHINALETTLSRYENVVAGIVKAHQDIEHLESRLAELEWRYAEHYHGYANRPDLPGNNAGTTPPIEDKPNE